MNSAILVLDVTLEEKKMSKISVLLVEDHHVVRKGISYLLSLEADIDIVGEAEDGNEGIQMAKELCPDIIILDITMPNLNGIDAVRRIRKSVPNAKVIILTMHTREQYIRQALREGASGYLLKESTQEELVNAIKTVYKGDVALSPSISKFVFNEYVKQSDHKQEVDSLELLTDRERQVLRLIAEGKTNKDIAKCLDISKSTVNIHRTNVMQKLDIHDTVGLVRYSIEKGIIVVDN
jgi:two-component system, NarL family, response regulator NreC